MNDTNIIGLGWRRVAVWLTALVVGCAQIPASRVAVPPGVGAALRQTVPTAALNDEVTQATIGKTICQAGYTALVRPSTGYTNGVKRRLLEEANIPVQSADRYELDHHIPLALGGNPCSLENLVLQPWDGEDGARKKDRLERKLQLLVCAGAVTLDAARSAIGQRQSG